MIAGDITTVCKCTLARLSLRSRPSVRRPVVDGDVNGAGRRFGNSATCQRIIFVVDAKSSASTDAATPGADAGRALVSCEAILVARWLPGIAAFFHQHGVAFGAPDWIVTGGLDGRWADHVGVVDKLMNRVLVGVVGAGGLHEHRTRHWAVDGWDHGLAGVGGADHDAAGHRHHLAGDDDLAQALAAMGIAHALPADATARHDGLVYGLVDGGCVALADVGGLDHHVFLRVAIERWAPLSVPHAGDNFDALWADLDRGRQVAHLGMARLQHDRTLDAAVDVRLADFFVALGASAADAAVVEC